MPLHTNTIQTNLIVAVAYICMLMRVRVRVCAFAYVCVCVYVSIRVCVCARDSTFVHSNNVRASVRVRVYMCY